MRYRHLSLELVAIGLALACAKPGLETREPFRAPAISNTVDGVVFEAGNWEPHLPPGAEGMSWGNHRAVVVVTEPADNTDAVLVTIPWRRHDPEPASKAIVVVDASSGEPVRNALAFRVENVSGDVVFQPNSNSTVYHVYYMPWQSTGGHYPRVTYPATVLEPEAAWARSIRSKHPADFPRARTTHIQSVNDFHSYFPMEVIASDSETAEFMARATDGWALVAEHRDYPVRMRWYIPHHWVERTETATFRSRGLRDESFAFQVVAVAGDRPLNDVRVEFAGFPAAWLESLTCFNCGGVNEKGERFEKDVSVPTGAVQPLWVGLRIPPDQRPGTYEGEVTVSARERGGKTIRVVLEVQDGRIRNAGFDNPDLMTRLVWLNSTAGSESDLIIEPFEPVRIDGHSLSILGRRVELAPSGLPENIFSYFTPELTYLSDEPDPLLARPITLDVIIGGRAESFQPSTYEVQQETRGRAHWMAESKSEQLSMQVAGALEYDGMLDCRITLVALRDLAVDDIVLPVSLVPDAAEYMLGLGFRGGKRPERVDWKWKIENHQEGVWLGGIHKGLQWVLRDENYVRPLNTNFYRNQPLNLPPSWFNEGRGGIRIVEEGGTDAARPEDPGPAAQAGSGPAARAASAPSAVTAYNYSGPRTLAAGDTLHFNVRFLITPFKPIDTRTHFNTRFVHQYVPVDSVVAWGGTVVNVHHATEINPYINYPFLTTDQLSAYTAAGVTSVVGLLGTDDR